MNKLWNIDDLKENSTIFYGMLNLKKILSAILDNMTVKQYNPDFPIIDIGVVDYCVAYKCGKIVMLQLTVKNNNSIHSGAYVFQGFIEDGFMPKTATVSCVAGIATRLMWCEIWRRRVQIRNISGETLNAGGSVSVTFTYFIA